MGVEEGQGKRRHQRCRRPDRLRRGWTPAMRWKSTAGSPGADQRAGPTLCGPGCPWFPRPGRHANAECTRFGTRRHDFKGVAPGNGHEAVQFMKAIGPEPRTWRPRLTLALGKATRVARLASTIEVAILLEPALIVSPILVDLDAEPPGRPFPSGSLRGSCGRLWQDA